MNKDDIYKNIAKVIVQFKMLSSAEKSQMKRLNSPEKLKDLPVYYNLLANAGLEPSVNWERSIYFLPFLQNDSNDEGSTIGKAFALNKSKDEVAKWQNKICHLIRLSYPKDIIELRRMIVHAEIETLNMHKLCTTLYFWNKDNKQNILKDFVFSTKD